MISYDILPPKKKPNTHFRSSNAGHCLLFIVLFHIISGQFKGYKKVEVIEGTAINEVTGERNNESTKIHYYHQWCFQLHQLKQTQEESWNAGVAGHFRAIELAEQQQQRRLEATAEQVVTTRHAEEADRAAKENRKQQQQRIEVQERRLIEAALEQARLADEQAQQQKEEQQKEASLMHKAGKSLFAVKNAVTAVPCMNNKAVDENATSGFAKEDKIMNRDTVVVVYDLDIQPASHIIFNAKK
jgi:flagellar biosynthesis GTPase FlhF